MKAFFFDIEPYHIHVSGMHLIVLPMEDGVYRVSYHKKLLADLYTEITAAAGEVERACCSFDSLSW